MGTFIFKFDKHAYLIDSFLESAALAHGHSEIKSQDWFYWKFKDNPFGETILACAEEKGEIIGCVAFGAQPFILRDKKLNGVISFETFVHPNHQGKGVFSKLLKLAEMEVSANEIDFMLNFPNSNSLRGFLKYNWKKIESPEYWIKGKRIATIPLSLKHLKKSFNPAKSNLSTLKPPKSFSQNLNNNILSSVINLDYLKWRFFSYPISEYVVIDTEIFYSILRMGNRGEVREAQVLFINIKQEYNFRISTFLKECKLKSNYDIISLPISKCNPIKKYLKKYFFIGVPNQTNICYKILNPENIKDSDVRSLSLSAINYHTY